MNNILKIQKSLKFVIDLKFAIVILAIIAIASSLGTYIEQDETLIRIIMGIIIIIFISFFTKFHISLQSKSYE